MAFVCLNEDKWKWIVCPCRMKGAPPLKYLLALLVSFFFNCSCGFSVFFLLLLLFLTHLFVFPSLAGDKSSGGVLYGTQDGRLGLVKLHGYNLVWSNYIVAIMLHCE